MNDFEIDFVLNNADKLSVIAQAPVEDLNLFSDASIVLLKDNERYLLHRDYGLHDNMYVLKALLTRALNNQLPLHPSITEDIGCLFNQDLLGVPGLTYTKLDKHDDWVGQAYLLWYAELATWLYNDAHGSIVLHVTPVYPGYYFNFDISYEQWAASCRPVLTIEIPKDVARLWLEQVQKIVDIIEWNSNNWDTRKSS